MKRSPEYSEGSLSHSLEFWSQSTIPTYTMLLREIATLSNEDLDTQSAECLLKVVIDVLLICCIQLLLSAINYIATSFYCS